jgi:hypothetical protein
MNIIHHDVNLQEAPMEKTITLFNNDWDIKFDFDITASHVERVGHIGMRETVLDDWDITIQTINNAPPDCFTPKFMAMVVEALENDTDLIQRESELHSMDWFSDEADRRHDERKEAVG